MTGGGIAPNLAASEGGPYAADSVSRIGSTEVEKKPPFLRMRVDLSDRG